MTVDRMKKRSISCVNFECLLLVVIVSIVLLNNLPNMRLKGTITEQNLLKAFAGESQARNRYTFFAQTAKEEGYEQIAAIFAETADQELAHARRFFDFLDEGGMVTIEAEYPAGRIGKTKENLYEAAEGELLEWSDLYSNFSTIAVDEGFKDVAAAFRFHPLFWLPVPVAVGFLFRRRIPRKVRRVLLILVCALFLGTYIVRLLSPEDTVVVWEPTRGFLYRLLSGGGAG